MYGKLAFSYLYLEFQQNHYYFYIILYMYMYVGQCFGYNCILGECYALWCECEQSSRQYCKPRQILAEQHRQEETVLGALFCDSVAFVLAGSGQPCWLSIGLAHLWLD